MTRRLRVARIITRLNVGGPALQAVLLTQRLNPRRFESLLVAGTPGPAEGDFLRLRDVQDVAPAIVPELGREISPLADLRAFGRLVGILRSYRPDIVHTHLAKAGLLGRLAARLLGVPVVVHTFHGNVLRGYFGPGTSRLFLELERWLARLSDRVVAISSIQAAELRALRIADGERLVEIPLGLDLEAFLDAPRGRLRAELGIGPETPLIGLVARLVPIKGVDVFLEAAARVAKALTDPGFVVVGDGPLMPELVERASQLGIGQRVCFLGWRADLPAIYADLDVVALTSRNEGTPLSVIEALAAGRPVVATSVGGVPDVIEHGRSGVLVPDGDAAAIAAAVISLLRDADRRTQLGREGRRRVYPAYDAAALISRIDALYMALTEGRATH